jgi:peptidyl-prolyl cis-trans isomerase SurA
MLSTLAFCLFRSSLPIFDSVKSLANIRLGQVARPRVLLYLLAAFSVLPAVAVTQESDTVRVDRIVAIVNDEAVTDSELARRTREVRTRLSQQNLNFPPEAVFRQQVLESLVTERLQLQLARTLNIKISPDKVEQTIADLARRNGVSVQDFLADASRAGSSPESLRDDLRSQLLIQQLLDREVRDRVSVTEREVENFLSRRTAASDAAYDFSHILVALPEHASPDAAATTLKRATELRARLAGGADFAEAAVAESQGPTALNGGQMGWKPAGQLPDLFLNALEALQPGGVSDLLRGSNGFHILKLNDRRGGDSSAPVNEAHVRQILIRPTEILTPEAARARIEQLRARIEQGDDFAELARAHSEDISSAREGGDLGWIAPGQMPPDFDRAIADLAPKELSGPLRTSAGFHLVQVLDRRTRDVSAERQVARARNQIHARKSEERYEQWLRELRDTAYVEYRADSSGP